MVICENLEEGIRIIHSSNNDDEITESRYRGDHILECEKNQREITYELMKMEFAQKI